MSNITRTGKAAHDTTVVVAEATRQAAVTPTATRATVVAAEATFYQTVAKSAVANVASDVGVGSFMQALKAMGRDLYT